MMDLNDLPGGANNPHPNAPAQWHVVKRADQLRPGDRFVFTEELGGEGEVVTVASLATYFGTAEVGTEEVDFTISMVTNQMVPLVPDEEEQHG